MDQWIIWFFRLDNYRRVADQVFSNKTASFKLHKLCAGFVCGNVHWQIDQLCSDSETASTAKLKINNSGNIDDWLVDLHNDTIRA